MLYIYDHDYYDLQNQEQGDGFFYQNGKLIETAKKRPGGGSSGGSSGCY